MQEGTLSDYELAMLGIAVETGVFIALGVIAFLHSTIEEDAGDNQWLPPTWVFWSRSLERAGRHLDPSSR
jgi:hypothetical protein